MNASVKHIPAGALVRDARPDEERVQWSALLSTLTSKR
jgi:hypothetical protein